MECRRDSGKRGISRRTDDDIKIAEENVIKRQERRRVTENDVTEIKKETNENISTDRKSVIRADMRTWKTTEVDANLARQRDRSDFSPDIWPIHPPHLQQTAFSIDSVANQLPLQRNRQEEKKG